MVRQRRPRTLYVGTQGVAEYRSTIPHYVTAEDVVLEVGCEWGTTTRLLAEHAREAIGTDISPQCIAEARRRYPHIRFEAIDAFDIPALLGLEKRFTKIYVDLSGFSGYAALLDLISLLQMYSHTLEPEVIVVKSRALKTFAARCIAWSNPPKTRATKE